MENTGSGSGGDFVSVTVSGDAQGLQTELGKATSYSRQFSASLISAFDGVTAKGRSFNDVIGQVTLSLSKMVLQSSLRPLQEGLSELMASSLSGLGSGVAAFAAGGVLKSGVPIPFANGGVVASPVTFPLGDGRTGLAGERGAEAILPLTRGSDGKLGIRTSSSGGGQTIVFNVQANDAESFRRSETQIAAMVARAVSAGNRNL